MNENTGITPEAVEEYRKFVETVEMYRKFAKELHELADYIQRNADKFPKPYFGSPRVDCQIYVAGKPELDQAKKAMTPGTSPSNPLTKSATDFSSEIKRKFGDEIEFGFWASRSDVCERVQVGVKLEPVVKRVETDEMREVPIYEWKCD